MDRSINNTNINLSATPATQKTSYSNVVSQQQPLKHPSKNQAIVLTSIDGIKLHDYIIAIGAIVGPKNVIFASRIANNRICIYLSSSTLIDSLLKNHKTVNVQNNEIELRRLITPAQRLVISNICPTIPNSEIEKLLLSLNIKLLSRITFLRVGMPESEYSHILSFRRQVYISPSENTSLPESVVLTFEDTPYRLFFSLDGLNCLQCRKTGHRQEECRQNSHHSETDNNINQDSPPAETPQTSNDVFSNTTNVIQLPQEPSAIANKKSTEQASQQEPATLLSNLESTCPSHAKRQLSNSSDSTATESQNTFSQPKDIPPKKKKANISMELTTKLLEPAREFIEGKKEITGLSFPEIADYIENAHGNKNPLAIAKDYTENLNDLTTLLSDIHLLIKDRGLKTKITKIKKKLTAQISETEYSDTHSDTSQETF